MACRPFCSDVKVPWENILSALHVAEHRKFMFETPCLLITRQEALQKT